MVGGFFVARQCGVAAVLNRKQVILTKSFVCHITPTRMGVLPNMCNRRYTLLMQLFAFVAEIINLIFHATW